MSQRGNWVFLTWVKLSNWALFSLEQRCLKSAVSWRRGCDSHHGHVVFEQMEFFGKRKKIPKDTQHWASCKKHSLVGMSWSAEAVLFPAGPLEWCSGRSPRWRSSRTRAWPTSRCCASSWKEGCWRSPTIVPTCCKCHHCPAGTACASWALRDLLLQLPREGLGESDSRARGCSVSASPLFYGSETFQKTTLLWPESHLGVSPLISKPSPGFVLPNKIRLNKSHFISDICYIRGL